MIKKGLAVAVILLFIGMCIVPSSAVQEFKEKPSPISFDGNTLYVGGSGPNNYTTIQSAIDDAVDGDTVYVYEDSSPYFENVVVGVSISLIGEDKNTTIVDGDFNGHVINIVADDVTIRGFTLQNGRSGIYSGSGIYITDYSNAFISGNIITNTSDGVMISRSSYNVISNNYVFLTEHNGIYFGGAQYNTISDNYINQSDTGIFFSNSNDNTIIRNNIQNCYFLGGMYLIYSDYNNISNNIVKQSDSYGIYFGYSQNNLAIGNIISNNNYGFVICGLENTLEYNAIINNTQYGVFSDKVGGSYLRYNNFIGNAKNADFNFVLFNGLFRLFGFKLLKNMYNTWSENYWDDCESSEKCISGTLFLFISNWGYNNYIFPFDWDNFDYNPAQEPYDI